MFRYNFVEYGGQEQRFTVLYTRFVLSPCAVGGRWAAYLERTLCSMELEEWENG
jgi:hypothetical protein